MMLMPIMFSAFMLFLPLGLVLYIFVNTLMTVVQQYMYQKDISLLGLFRKAPSKQWKVISERNPRGLPRGERAGKKAFFLACLWFLAACREELQNANLQKSLVYYK